MNYQPFVEFCVNVRLGKPVSNDLKTNIQKSIQDIRKRFKNNEPLQKVEYAILFEFALQQPFNKFRKYSQEEYDCILDFWEIATQDIAEILNS